MIAAVLDTNILASGFAGFVVASDRAPARLVRAWIGDQFELITSEPILAELARTFAKPYFVQRLTREQVDRALMLLRNRARITPLTITVSGVATHPKDGLVIATALSGGVSHLVTGDIPPLRSGGYRGVTFITARAFLALLDEPEGGRP